jgi:hypothetical protein
LVVVVCGSLSLLSGLGWLANPDALGSVESKSGVQLASGACNPVNAIAKSALYVNLPEPSKNLSANGTITSSLEFQVVNYTPADNLITLYFPSIYFTFPLATGGNFSYYIPPHSVNITASGWSSPSLLSRSDVVSHGLVFVPNGTARLTSQKVAIMATTGYGNLTVEFRWQFSLQQWGSTKVTHSAWSIPTNKSKNGGQLPSIFYPAPYVSYLGGTGSVGVIGTNFTATLGGDVAGRLFFLEMESGGGFVAQDFGQTAPSGVSTFNVTIPIINYDGELQPSTMLVHIHDSCGALLYNKVFKAVYAPNATVKFLLTPSVCTGAITFNGSKFTNGTSGVFVPSPHPYSFSIPSCKGHKFSNWLTTGGLHIASGSTMDVSASGTFTVMYQ